MSEKKIKQAANHIDYKDITAIGNHLNPHSRMNGRKRTGFKVKEQRDFARSVKRARFMALVPYISY